MIKSYAKYYYQSLLEVLRLIILSLKLEPQDFTWAIHLQISPVAIRIKIRLRDSLILYRKTKMAATMDYFIVRFKSRGGSVKDLDEITQILKSIECQ